MARRPGSPLGLDHLIGMGARIQAGDFSAAKVGRWLGWAQCAVVAAGIGLTLDDMKQINLSHADDISDDDLIRRLQHFEAGGTVVNPKALLRDAIAELERNQRLITEFRSRDESATGVIERQRSELERLRRVEADANRRLCDD